MTSVVAAYRASSTHFLSWYHAAYHDSFQPIPIMPRDIRHWQA